MSITLIGNLHFPFCKPYYDTAFYTADVSEKISTFFIFFFFFFFFFTTRNKFIRYTIVESDAMFIVFIEKLITVITFHAVSYGEDFKTNLFAGTLNRCHR
jgi:hypothetical protein